MNNKKSIGIAVSLISLSLAQSTLAEVTRRHVTRTDVPIFVECLNDTIILDFEADIVISEVATYRPDGAQKTWTFTRSVRQYGEAVDSLQNTWKFRGHFSTVEHVLDGDWWDNHNFHLLSRDIFVAERGGLDVNLSFQTQWHLRKVDGVYEIEVRETSVSCMPM